jgi:hypothetical protein
MPASSLSWDNESILALTPEQVSEVRATGVARTSTWSARALGRGSTRNGPRSRPAGTQEIFLLAKTLDQASGSTQVAVERGLQAYTAATLAGARKPFLKRTTSDNLSWTAEARIPVPQLDTAQSGVTWERSGTGDSVCGATFCDSRQGGQHGTAPS